MYGKQYGGVRDSWWYALDGLALAVMVGTIVGIVLAEVWQCL